MVVSVSRASKHARAWAKRLSRVVLAGVLTFTSVAPVGAADPAVPWLGVSAKEVPVGYSEAFGGAKEGALIAGVAQGSPAQKAGLQPGDLITAIDGQAVNKDHSFFETIKGLLPGLSMTITFVREGRTESTRATLTAAPKEFPPLDRSYFAGNGPMLEDPSRHEVAGATLATLTPAIAEPLGLGADARGAVILSVARGSSAEEMGLIKGDAIFSVNGHRTTTALAAAEAFVASTQGDKMALLLMGRGEKISFATLGPKPLGLRSRWGPLYDLVGKTFVDADGSWLTKYSWLRFGEQIVMSQHHPGIESYYNYAWIKSTDGRIEYASYVKKADGSWGFSGEVTQTSVLSDTDLDYIGKGFHNRTKIKFASGSLQVDSFQVKRDGTLKPTTTSTAREVDEAQIPGLAAAYRRKQAQIAQQQQAQAQASSSGGGHGGLLGALGGAMLGAMAGGNTSQVVGAAMKGAAIVDPNAAALGSVGDSLISGNRSQVSSIGGINNTSGGSYPTRPNLVDGTPACSMMNMSNYRTVSLSGGNDVQLKTMCGQAFEYYHMYLNAISQGYSEADANRTYAAHEGAAQNAISFFQNNR